MRQIAGMLAPPVTFGTILGLGIVGNHNGWIPDPVWRWLWPLIVAAGLLAAAGVLFWIGVRRWVSPLAAGFLVQTVCVFLLAVDQIESPWTTLWVTLVAMAIVALVLGVFWLITTIRAKRIERMMTETDEEEIRKSMVDAMRKLERAVGRRNAVYELPWFLVFGRAAVGKTTAIKNSGLGLPMREDTFKGRGGTTTLNFFFTNEMIFLDTPGRWAMEGADEESLGKWRETLRLLRKYRRRRPLDGLVMVVAADDLLQNTEDELEEQAANIREVMDLIHEELNFRIPVYVIVSKCDLIQGFTKFFKGLPAQRRDEILGWSNADPNEGKVRRQIAKAFPRVIRRLEAYRLEMLARLASTTAARELFFFTEEFKRIQEPLSTFLEVLFKQDRYHEPPVFRGFYFTSGTQGEGSPLGQAMGDLARTLGVPVPPPQAEEEETKRSYFLLELFRELMVGDEGLVGRTAVHWFRRRRDTVFLTLLPAVIAGGLFCLSGISFLRNYGLYEQIRTEVPEITAKLEEYRSAPIDFAVPRALEETERLRQFHRKMVSIDPFRRFWMRRPGELRDRTLQLFEQELLRSVWMPTLRQVELLASDPDESCSDRTDMLYGVIWLRQGNRREWSDDLRGFERVWGLSAREASEVRKELAFQFGYMLDHVPREQTFLPGFPLLKVAESIQEACTTRGGGSPMEQYVRIQRECAGVSGEEASDCYKRLQRVLLLHKEDYARLERNLDYLQQALDEIRDEEAEAKQAQMAIAGTSLPDLSKNECLNKFNDEILPRIQEHMNRDDDLLKECVDEYEATKDRSRIVKVMREFEDQRQADLEELTREVELFQSRCEDAIEGGFEFDTGFLEELSNSRVRFDCLGAPPPPPRRAAAQRPAPAPIAAPAPRATLQFFEPPKKINRRYTGSGYEARREDWESKRVFAEAAPVEEEKEAFLREIRRGVDAYAQEYALHWEEYLEGLELKPRHGSTAGWLAGLADTQEYGKLIDPAAEALRDAARDREPLYEALPDRLEPLEKDVTAFSSDGEKLADYQQHLRTLAATLRRCEEDQGFYREFRRTVMDNRPNPLREATDWVNRYAGNSVAKGALKDLFLEPLDAAGEFVSQLDLAKVQWGEFSAAWKRLDGRFPFGGGPTAELADKDDLIAVFGMKSGLVHSLAEVSTGRLTPEAADWLEEARALSEILFRDGTDDFRLVEVTISAGDLRFDPAEDAKEFDPQQLWISFGGGQERREKPEEFKAVSLGFSLFGPRASTQALLAITVAERKGAWGRAFGKNYREGETQEVAEAQGIWAPLELFAEGLPEGARPRGISSLNLEYRLDLPLDKRTVGLTIPLEVQAQGLGDLILLFDRPFPPPPADPLR